MFPVYGFGGQVGYSPVSHCFPICRISPGERSDEAYGVEGIMTAYSAALRSVGLAGPTLFSEVLETAMARASHPTTQESQRYDVLVILTDGIINDMRQVGPTTTRLRLPGLGARRRVERSGVGARRASRLAGDEGDGPARPGATNAASRGACGGPASDEWMGHQASWRPDLGCGLSTSPGFSATHRVQDCARLCAPRWRFGPVVPGPLALVLRLGTLAVRRDVSSRRKMLLSQLHVSEEGLSGCVQALA